MCSFTMSFGRVEPLAIKTSIPFGLVNFTAILFRWALAALTKQEYETDDLVAAAGGGGGGGSARLKHILKSKMLNAFHSLEAEKQKTNAKEFGNDSNNMSPTLDFFGFLYNGKGRGIFGFGFLFQPKGFFGITSCDIGTSSHHIRVMFWLEPHQK